MQKTRILIVEDDVNINGLLKEALEKDLQLDTSTINCEFVTSRTQEKYSVSHNENRIYNHNYSNWTSISK